MRRLLLSSPVALVVSFVLCGLMPLAQAQDGTTSTPSNEEEAAAGAAGGGEPSAAPEGEVTAPEGGSAPAAEPAPAAPENPRVLEPPNLGPLNVEPNSSGPRLPDPSASADRLQQTAPVVPEKRGWTLPETVFHLHGYFRMRANFLRDGDLGHRDSLDRLPAETRRDANGTPVGTIQHANYDPFIFFKPNDSATRASGGAPIDHGCGSSSGAAGKCDRRGQVSGDMRFRLKPEIHLSDDVRVKAWIDVLDNVGLGTMGYGPGTQPSDVSASSTMRARRLWGEARNRDIGELRFGRMGADWGLGILDNGGDRYGIDSDFSTEVDRVMGITNLAGYYLMAAYDWASEGKVLGKTQSPSGVPVDQGQKDDHQRLTLAAAHKLEADVQQSALARGESVFNYGVYFVYQKQFLSAASSQSGYVDGVQNAANEVSGLNADGTADNSPLYNRLNQRTFTPDLWFQALWNGLRVELEAAFVAGSREGSCPVLYSADATGNHNYAYQSGTEQSAQNLKGTCKFRQLGIALESEYRLFDERLGIFFNSGFASGDSNAYGLAKTNDPQYQKANGTSRSNNTISTYQFHPDYRVDLILWRTVMQRVAGAYYFKPGVGYDFIRDPYGQQAGARIDAIYSRASARAQTWGHSANLGLELDLSLYYRSEDGPDVMDGFYGLIQYGILFPFQGLEVDRTGAPSGKNAMILRGVAGIAF